MDLLNELSSVTSNATSAVIEAKTVFSNTPDICNQLVGNVILEPAFETGHQIFGSFFPVLAMFFGLFLLYIFVKEVLLVLHKLIKLVIFLFYKKVKIELFLFSILVKVVLFLLSNLVKVVTGFIRGTFSAFCLIFYTYMSVLCIALLVGRYLLHKFGK